MANRFNDRDRSYDRDREEQNYLPRKDRERFRSEGQQGRSQDWREIGGQEDMDWYQTSGSQQSQQYGRGREGRVENRGSEIEGPGRQDRFSNQEFNRGYGRSGEHQFGRGHENWEDPEASTWGFRESRGFENPMYREQDRGHQPGQLRFRQQGLGQGQQFGEGHESWRERFGQQTFGTPGTTGRFSGRGPKGYRRSDDRILEDINERLTTDPDIDATEIEVQVIAGEVTLLGTVDDRETKRRAEDIAESVSGVNDVQNQIKVKNKNHEQSGQTFGKEQYGKDQKDSTQKYKSTSNKDK